MKNFDWLQGISLLGIIDSSIKDWFGEDDRLTEYDWLRKWLVDWKIDYFVASDRSFEDEWLVETD